MVIDIVQKKVEQSKGRRGGSGAGGDAGDGGARGGLQDTMIRSLSVQAGKQSTLGVSKRGSVLII